MKKILLIFCKTKGFTIALLTIIVLAFSYASVRASVQIQYIIDSFVNKNSIVEELLIFISLSVIVFILNNLIVIITRYLETTLSIHLKEYVLKKLFRYRTSDISIENIIEIWNKDISEFVTLISSILNPSLINVCVGALALYQITKINLWFSFFTILISMILIPLMKLFGKKISVVALRKREHTKKLNSQTLNFLKNRLLIINYRVEKWIQQDLNNLSKKIFYDVSLFTLVSNLSRISKRIISSLLPISILLYSSILFNSPSSSITIGAVVASLSLISNVSTGINSLIDVYTKLKVTQERTRSLKLFYEGMMFKKNELESSYERIDTIVLDNISFITSDGSCLLKNISLNIDSGEKIAIIGESGSGKTTLLKILLGLIEPTKGKILVNGIALDKEKLTSYWEKIIYIPSIIYIAPGTLLSNIGNIKLDNEEINKIGLTNVYRTIGADHENISGGEEKKVAFLRDITSNENHQTLTVMDEISTGVDVNTVNYMAEKIKKINGTVVLVTHDISLAKKMDKIIKISEGKLSF